jgi:hypothetical protein
MLLKICLVALIKLIKLLSRAAKFILVFILQAYSCILCDKIGGVVAMLQSMQITQ